MKKLAGIKARDGYDNLIAKKQKEIDKFVHENQGVMLAYFRLQKEIIELRQKRTNVMIGIAKDLCDNKTNHSNER